MVNRFIYEVQLGLLEWLTRRYRRPRDVEEYLKWYPRARKERSDVYRLIQHYFPGAITLEKVGTLVGNQWRTTLIIRIQLPPNSPPVPYATECAFLDDWIEGKTFTGKIQVLSGW